MAGFHDSNLKVPLILAIIVIFMSIKFHAQLS